MGNNVNQVTLMIRLVVGGYLDYLAYSLLQSFLKNQMETQTERIVILIATILFAVIGTVLAVASLYRLMTKKYATGEADMAEQQETESIEADTIEK